MRRRCGTRFPLSLLLGFVVALLVPAGSALAVPCSRAGTLGANLLVPYFEVDLDSASGKTTLFSIGNATARARMTEVTVWSDWGIRILSFLVHLGPDAVQTINLRDVLTLRLPSLAGADPDDFPGCGTQPPPKITAADLQARLTGAPASDGKCYGRARGERRIAVGYVTVDFASSCAAALAGAGSKGLADDSEANIFYGDVFYVDPSQASAQGMPAIGIRHDPDSGDYSLAAKCSRAPAGPRCSPRRGPR